MIQNTAQRGICDQVKRAASLFWIGYRLQGKHIENSTPRELASMLIRVTDGACDSLQTLLATTQESHTSAVRDYFSAVIFSQAPDKFIEYVEKMVRETFKDAHASFFKSKNVVHFPSKTNSLLSFWWNVYRLDWYRFFDETIHFIIYQGIECCVSGLCSAKYDSPMLGGLDQWKNSVLLPWLASIASRNSCWIEQQHTETNNLQSLGHLVNLVLDENYVSARVRELYNIIAEYPESTCAILELRSALSRTQQHHLLALSLRMTLEHRLLHAGANTSQIIDMYISTIKVLRVLDPHDVLLDTATCPVREYLQKRKDTVRCIVANLTDDISGELYEELNQTSDAEQSFIKDQHDEDQLAAGPGNEDWIPKSNKSHGMTARSMGDILAMLISIYGTTEIFVNEYRLMLSNKLLAKLELEDTTQELKYLELLKFRFGDAALHHCEIMLRDVEDSKRLNKWVHGGFVQATIISQVFWPVVPDSAVALHPRVKSVLSSFEQIYDSVKTPRRLIWKKETGMAQLELDLGPGGKKVFTVSVAHANIILHFHGCDTRTLKDLTVATRMPHVFVKNRVAFW
eukprot:CAMPEP_0119261140 /NCGR_PEP_ID=MMETSP1329-20130426/1278_1 /TAXON_ID=114041 /ORGANISM="Genus nov. species nov., Strain RCC1024" /LENGTH=570 /DNA_ID=CAMNT_0007260643 /DNA_START=295 /DNA_END=2004 /DNA_ORIENTATION=+